MPNHTKKTEQLVKKAKKIVEEWKQQERKIPEVVPTIEGLALELGITRKTFYKYAREDETFKRIKDEVEEMQIRRLIQLGLMGKVRPEIVKLLLAKHGFMDKTEVVEKKLIVLEDDEE